MRSRFRFAIAAAFAGALAIAGPAHARSPTARAYDAGLNAYVHGYPPVLSRLSQATFPLNALVGVAATATPSARAVVLPNVDTAYSVARLDLRAEPMVVHVPAIPGRYYSFQLMDAYTNVYGYIGTRVSGSAAGDQVIVGPGYAGALPAGMRVLRSPTADVLMLGRTLVNGPGDLGVVADLLGQFTLTPLSAYVAGVPRPRSFVIDAVPARSPPVLPSGLQFFDAMDEILAADPPTAAERRALSGARQYGIGPGIVTSQQALDPAIRRALERAVRDGPARVAALADAARRRSVRGNAGWSLLDPRTGDFGADFDLRAVTARIGLWANTPAEAAYIVAADDDGGHRLNGAHRYALSFTSSPPAKAFWSLTMYDRELHLYANPLDRYAIGDRTPGLRHGARGTLTLELQHEAPAAGAANWLPAPSGRFVVALRLYIPGRKALDGRWKPPGIRCLDCRP